MFVRTMATLSKSTSMLMTSLGRSPMACTAWIAIASVPVMAPHTAIGSGRPRQSASLRRIRFRCLGAGRRRVCRAAYVDGRRDDRGDLWRERDVPLFKRAQPEFDPHEVQEGGLL